MATKSGNNRVMLTLKDNHPPRILQILRNLQTPKTQEPNGKLPQFSFSSTSTSSAHSRYRESEDCVVTCTPTTNFLAHQNKTFANHLRSSLVPLGEVLLNPWILLQLHVCHSNPGVSRLSRCFPFAFLAPILNSKLHSISYPPCRRPLG